MASHSTEPASKIIQRRPDQTALVRKAEFSEGCQEGFLFQVECNFFCTIVLMNLPPSFRFYYNRSKYNRGQTEDGCLYISRGGSTITVVSGGTDSVIQTLPPITDRSPITVSPPRMVAPE